jgi:hypothetical protein
VFGWLLVGQVLHDIEEFKAEDGGEGGGHCCSERDKLPINSALKCYMGKWPKSESEVS